MRVEITRDPERPREDGDEPEAGDAAAGKRVVVHLEALAGGAVGAPSSRSDGVRCPYCHADLVEGALAGECSACRTLHHLQCFGEQGGCSTHGCGSTRARTTKVGDPTGVPAFTALSCFTCRQALPLEAVVARCTGCANSLHIACYELMKGCPLARTGACQGTVELMSHAEASACQVRRHGLLVALACVLWTLTFAVAIALAVADRQGELVAWFVAAGLLGPIGVWLSLTTSRARALRLEAQGRTGRTRGTPGNDR